MNSLTSFENEHKKKAAIVTLASYLILLLLLFFIRWSSQPPTPAPVMDLMEINLGNNDNGDGDEQPLIKGNKTITKDQAFSERSSANNDEKINTDENGDADVAATNKNKTGIQSNRNSSSNGNTVNNRKPKLTYNGPNTGQNGNNNDVDNNFRSQGNLKSGNGDNGNPNGDKDSYGDTEGGKIGGPKIIRGNRRIIQNYEFQGDLNRATVYASIRVSPSGRGSFIKFEKGSTSTGQSYANAITRYLNNIQFNKNPEESVITVEFFFDVK